MSEWKLVNSDPPPMYKNVLLAFEEHWNQVVGFRTGRHSFHETSAHDHNAAIVKPWPKWWAEIPDVPHRTHLQMNKETA